MRNDRVLPRRPILRLRAQDGFTLVETMLAVAMLGIALAVSFGVLTSLTSQSARVTNRSQALADARTAVETISRDLRAANPIDAVTPVSLYDSEMGFTIFCSSAGSGQCDAQNRLHVIYRVLNHSLYRIVGSGGAAVTKPLIGPRGPASLALADQPGSIVIDSSQPIFRYYDATNNLLSTSAVNGAPPTSFRDCAKTLEIHLRIVADAKGTVPAYDIDTKILLRNYHVVAGC